MEHEPVKEELPEQTERANRARGMCESCGGMKPPGINAHYCTRCLQQQLLGDLLAI